MIRLQQMFEKKLKEQNDQLTNMMEANFEERRRERQAAVAQQKKLEEVLEELKESLKKRRVEIIEIDKQIEDSSKPGFMDILAPLASLAIGILSTRCSIM
jgi:hypothetical protein